jgi:hypothetical protein
MSESTWGGIDQSKDRPTCCVCNFRGPDSGSNGPAWLYLRRDGDRDIKKTLNLVFTVIVVCILAYTVLSN